MKIKKLIDFIENIAPLGLQESYDNAGLLTGNSSDELSGVLITLDVTEEIIQEASDKGVNFVLAHHPIIFQGLKRLTGQNYVQRTIIKALKEDIAIYAAHTNLDNIKGGVNGKISDLLELQNSRILSPAKGQLRKIVTFVPHAQLETVRKALFSAGAGHIGNYDKCSYISEGTGTFRAGEGSDPFIGKIGEFHFEPETRIETIFPKYRERDVIAALYKSHPYEEPAFDIYSINNLHTQIGAGMIGELKESEDALHFLKRVKEIFGSKCIRHTSAKEKKIKRVALCGGSGSFLLNASIGQKADIYISSDFKYHEFFDAEDRIIVADIGHYESEQFTKNLFYELVTKNFSNFVCSISEINTNPINYL